MAVSATVRQRVRQQAGGRCGYCRSQQSYLPYPLEIEHIMPVSRGGSDGEENLWLACRSCNMYKSNQVDAVDPLSGAGTPLFHPRADVWHEHFEWAEDGTHLSGKTAVGRATIVALQMNNSFALTARRNWVRAGWHPPRD